jgi:hypothetical protein
MHGIIIDYRGYMVAIVYYGNFALVHVPVTH